MRNSILAPFRHPDSFTASLARDWINWPHAFFTGSKGQAGRMKWMKQTEHPGVNKILELWVTKAMADGIHINREALCHKWTQFADMDGVPNDEWFISKFTHFF